MNILNRIYLYYNCIVSTQKKTMKFKNQQFQLSPKNQVSPERQIFSTPPLKNI